MVHKNKMHPTRQRAIKKVWQRGLTEQQKTILNVLDRLSKEATDEPSLEEIAELTGLSYGAVWTAIGVFEHYRYLVISRDHKGRAYHRAITFLHGLSLAEDDDDF